LSAKLVSSDRGPEGPESEGQEEEIHSNTANTVHKKGVLISKPFQVSAASGLFLFNKNMPFLSSKGLLRIFDSPNSVVHSLLVVVPLMCPSLRHLSKRRGVAMNRTGTLLNVPKTKESNESPKSRIRCSVLTWFMCDPARSASLLKEVGKMAPYRMTSNHTIATNT